MIKIKGLKKIYETKKNEPNTVIEGFNLDIADNGMFFLLGKSGSGKTTLLNLIGGLDGYNEGDIVINGRSSKNYSTNDYDLFRRDVIGFIFQEHNLIEGFTVYKNLSIALELQGQVVNHNKIMDALKQLEIDEFVDRYPEELSTGQKQRVAIARALVNSPEIILADEPTGSLDSETSDIVLTELKKLSKKHLVIIITHDKEYAFKYGDRVVEIADGVIINDSKPFVIDKTVKNKQIKELKDNKSRISFKNVVNLSFINLLSKRNKLIFTVLLSTMAFTLFGVADTISSYDEDKALLQTFDVVDRDYVIFTKEKTLQNDNNEFYGLRPSISDSDFEYLSENYPGVIQYEVFNNYIDIYDNLLDRDLVQAYTYEGNEYYTFDISGSTEITTSFLNDVGAEIIAGRLPEKNIDDNEVVITKYIFDTIAKFNLEVDGEIVEIENYDDVIGIVFDKFVIVGIIDTNLDEARYKMLDTEDSIYDTDTKRDISLEFQYLSNHGLHTMLYFRSGYYDDNLDNLEIAGIGYLSIKVPNDDSSLELGSVRSISRFSDLDNTVICVDGVVMDGLDENEVIIPYDMIKKFGMPGINIIEELSVIESMIIDKADELAEQYSIEHFNEIEVQLQADYPLEIVTIDYYKDYMLEIDNNTYHNGYDSEFFLNEARAIILNEILFPYFDLEAHVDFSNFGNLYDDLIMKVVGVYFPDEINFESGWNSEDIGNPLITSDSMYEYLDSDIGSVILILSNNQKESLQLINEGDDIRSQEIETDFILNSEFYTMLKDAGAFITFISIVLVSTGGFFAFFAGLLLYNFISTSIRNKQKDIGILRSIGASSKDVFKIFFVESLMISLICYVFSLLLTVPITIYFDHMMQTEFFVPVSFIYVGLRQIILLLVLSLVVSIIATLIPIYKFSKKKPIDLIKKSI